MSTFVDYIEKNVGGRRLDQVINYSIGNESDEDEIENQNIEKFRELNQNTSGTIIENDNDDDDDDDDNNIHECKEESPKNNKLLCALAIFLCIVLVIVFFVFMFWKQIMEKVQRNNMKQT